MRLAKCCIVTSLGVLALLLTFSQSPAEDALAFVTEAKGQAVVVRAKGAQEAAAVGGQLFAGDEVKVSEGKVVIVYLSGRSVEVAAGAPHKVQAETGGGSGQMKRLMDTLGEMVGAADETDRPVVHGMARNLPLTGASPANTRMSSTDFVFSWDALEGAEAYDFTLASSEGEALATRRLEGASLPAGSLGLEPGKRYVWSVMADFLIPHSTADNWVQVASREEKAQLDASIREVEKAYSGTTQFLLKAATFYKGGYYSEAQAILVSLKGREDVSSAQKMLKLIQSKMTKRDPLSSPEK